MTNYIQYNLVIQCQKYWTMKLQIMAVLQELEIHCLRTWNESEFGNQCIKVKSSDLCLYLGDAWFCKHFTCQTWCAHGAYMHIILEMTS